MEEGTGGHGNPPPPQGLQCRARGYLLGGRLPFGSRGADGTEPGQEQVPGAGRGAGTLCAARQPLVGRKSGFSGRRGKRGYNETVRARKRRR